MSFRDSTPSQVFRNDNADKLVKILDGIEEHKTQVIEKTVRALKTPLDTNLTWLRKRCEEYGYPELPYDFTKEQLDAILLNAENVMALKGSKMGLRYWLWTLTFGNITIDDEKFYPKSRYIIPNDLTYGYLSHINPDVVVDPSLNDPQTLYLFSDPTEDFGVQVLTITIETKYWLMQSMKDYIVAHIKKFIAFVDSNAQITITFRPGIYNTYTEPYQYFVIP